MVDGAPQRARPTSNPTLPTTSLPEYEYYYDYEILSKVAGEKLSECRKGFTWSDVRQLCIRVFKKSDDEDTMKN